MPMSRICSRLFLGGIKRRLAQLTDRQIGQLLWDHVLDELTLFGPGAAICEHAVRRLLRSEGGSWTANEKSVMDEDSPPCPACGSETVHHVGIGEPDFLLCARADSGHKESLGISGGKED
jgi:hypothetical protein